MSLTSGYTYYRIKLYLTDEQKEWAKKVSDARRFVYNWALGYSESLYENEGISFIGWKRLNVLLTELKQSPEFEWLRQFDSTTLKYSLKDLDNAYQRMFSGQCKPPKFKSKKRDTIRFASRPERITFKGENGRYVHIPGLSRGRDDDIDCKSHNIPYGKDISYTNARIKFDGIDYWLSLDVKTKPLEIEHEIDNDKVVGIDVGIRTTAVLYDGDSYTSYDRPNPHRLSVLINRRDKLRSAMTRDINRRLSESLRTKTKYEDVPKSKNQLKREYRYRKTCIQITNLYRSHYHKVSRDIANHGYNTVVLETLRIRPMQRDNQYVSPYIYEARLATLVNYIAYKCQDAGTRVIFAPDGYRSTKICSHCGGEYDVGESKIYHCPHCHTVIDRDENAATNLRNYGYQQLHQ